MNLRPVSTGRNLSTRSDPFYKYILPTSVFPSNFKTLIASRAQKPSERLKTRLKRTRIRRVRPGHLRNMWFPFDFFFRPD